MTDPNRHLRTGQLAPWPKGKPRNPPTAEWVALRKQIQKAMRGSHRRNGAPSYGTLARALGANRCTVRRWFLPADHPRAINPSPAFFDGMREWLSQNPTQ